MTTIHITDLPPIELRRCPRTSCGGQLMFFTDEFDRPQMKCTLCSREAVRYPVDRTPPRLAEHEESRARKRNIRLYEDLMTT